MQSKPLVVVLGGGYAGVRVALTLAKKKAARVILIDKKPYHALPTQFYELATFFRREHKKENRENLEREFHASLYSAAISLGEIFRAYPDVEVMQAEVCRVRPAESSIVLVDGRIQKYEWLVVALGSESNYFDIPHLENNSFGLKSAEEALNIRDRLDELFYNSPKHKKITVVIGGGGFTGCELAGEVVGYMKKLAQIHHHPIAHWSCVVIEAGSAVLGTSSLWAQQKAGRRLARLGVTFIFEQPIVDVWPNLLYLGKERKPFPFDLLIWTAGVKGGCAGDIIEGTELNKKSCVVVNETLRVGSYENIFTVGDIAATADPETGAPVPMTAQKAIHEASYVSKTLLVLIKNKNVAVRPYPPMQSNYIIPLGGKYALLETKYFRLSGFLPWLLKYVVVFKYVISILPLRRAISFTVGEMRLFTRND